MNFIATSFVGPLWVEYDADGLISLRYGRDGEAAPGGMADAPAADDEVGLDIACQLREYFAGERREFQLPLKPRGTAFQRAVWEALRRIPFGETRSYGEVARDAGFPGAARAVGQANRSNPIPIVIPCHRVLAANGGIGGYMGAWGSGSGIDVKLRLLRHEGVSADRS